MYSSLPPPPPCVRRVASVDQLLFEEASRRLDKDVAAAGARLQQALASLRAAASSPAARAKLLASDAEARRCMWMARGLDQAGYGGNVTLYQGHIPKGCTREGGQLPRQAHRLDCSPSWEHAPAQNFSSPNACFIGDQEVMETVWRQHASKKPVMDFLKLDPQVGRVGGGLWRHFRLFSRRRPTRPAPHRGDLRGDGNTAIASRLARRGPALAMLQHVARGRLPRNHTAR
jgi:hypothetical protein